MNTLLPTRIEAIRSPRNADIRTLRMCDSEQDAVKASITLSRLTLEEIGKRVGVSKQAISKWQTTGVPHKRTQAFLNATGTNLVRQYRDLERAMREATGLQRERDRIANIIAPTERAWGIAA